MNTTENNRLIAEFLGLQLEQDQERLFINGLGTKLINETFNTDWNWLMPVIEKILDISLNLDTMEMYYNITDCIPNITQTHIAVTDFIKWYNENK